MRELSSCDFCGDDAAGVYEVLPDEVDAPDAPRRLALCADCRDTLESVVSPLLNRIGTGTKDAEVVETASGRSATSATPTSERGAEPKSEAGSKSESGSASAESGSASPEPETDSSEPGSESAAESEPASETAPDSKTGTESKSGAESKTGTEPESASTPESEPASESEPQPTQSAAPKPAGYRKLMRLLQNREGAMPRDALHTLATNAYGMSDETFEEIVAAALENGDLVETADGLKA